MIAYSFVSFALGFVRFRSFSFVRFFFRVEFRSKFLLVRFTVGCSVQGKQMLLTLSPTNEATSPCTLLISFGLTGHFETCSSSAQRPAGWRFAFLAAKSGLSLVFVDSMRMAKWVEQTHFDSDRGPDPVYDHAKFVDNVRRAVARGALRSAPVCEALLDQRLFNGIGNYLRAEIMFAAEIWPFDNVLDVLRSPDKGARLLDACASVPRSSPSSRAGLLV